MLLAPLNFGFVAMNVAEKVFPNEEDRSPNVTDFSAEENALLTNVLNDFICLINDACSIQLSPPFFEHRRQLSRSTQTKYNDIPIIYHAIRIAGKAFFLSKRTGLYKFSETATGAIEGLENVFYNFPRALNTVLDYYSRFCGDDNEHMRFFGTKEIIIGLFLVFKEHLCVDALDLAGNDSPARKGKRLEQALEYFGLATSRMYIPSGYFLTSRTAKLSFNYLANPEIQKDVLATAIASYTLATNDKINFPAQLRLRLSWCSMNMLVMHCLAFQYHHGRHSYLSDTFLTATTYVARCWISNMKFFSTFSISEKKNWTSNVFLEDPVKTGIPRKTTTNRLCLMSGCPARLVNFASDQAMLDERDPSRSTIFSRNINFSLALTAVESFYGFAARVPDLLAAVEEDLGDAYQVYHSHMLARNLLEATIISVSHSEYTRNDMAVHIPKAISVAIAAMKMVSATIATPAASWSAVWHNYGKPITPENAKELVLKMFLSGFKAINAIEIFAVEGGADFSCPSSSKKELAALGLMVINAVQRLLNEPNDALCSNFHNAMLDLGLIRVSGSLASFVMPSDVGGIATLLGFANGNVTKLQGLGINENTRGTEGGAYRRQTEIIESLGDLLHAAQNASMTDEERAMKRNKLLGVLPCAYLGCTTFLLPGNKCKLCSGCKVVHYCSAACQNKDWKMHKVGCKATAAAARGKKK